MGVLGWTLVLAASIAGQEVQEPDPLRNPVELSVEAVEARIARVREIQGIAEDLKTAVEEAYSRALTRIREGNASQSAAATHDAGSASAAQDLADVQTRIAELEQARPAPLEGELAELEQALTNARAALQQAQADIQAADRESARRNERRAAIPTRIPEAQRELDDLLRRIEAPPAAGEHPYLAAARSTRQRAFQRALELELRVLRGEQAFYEATQGLVAARRQLAVRQASTATGQVDALQARVQELRLEEATREEQLAQQAAQQAQTQHPLLRSIAQENASLAQKRTLLTSTLQEAETELKLATDQLAELTGDFENVRLRVSQVGLTEAIGALLRQRRSRIPVPGRSLRIKAQRRGEEISRVRLELFDLEDQERTLDDPTLVDSMLSSFEPPISQGVREAATELLQTQRGIVTELLDDNTDYFNRLVDVDNAEQQILAGVAEYRDYINEHVLWIRSSQPVWRTDWRTMLEAGAWLTELENWRATASVTRERAILDPGSLFLLLLALTLLVSRSRLRRGLSSEGVLAAKKSTTAYWPTVRALAYTLLVALPFPVLLWTLGTALEGDPDQVSFPRALGAGLEQAAWVLFGLEFLRQILRAEGLGVAHFLWKPRSLALLRRNLSWLMWIVVPVACAVGLFATRDHAPWSGSLGRAALIVGLLALTWFLFKILHPRRGILADLSPATGWVVRLRWLWFVLGVGTSATLLLLALLGYGFTALQLVQRLEMTFGMLLAVFLVQALIVRALLLTHRKLAMEQARERRRVAKEAQEAPADMPDIPMPDEPEIDPSKIALQTRQLLRMAFGFVVVLGAWQIWVDVLPALGMFRQVTVWIADPNTDPPSVVTLANLFFAVLIAFVTFLAARNLPGFLELVVLRRLDIQEGERHAITTLVAYSMIGIGVIASFSVIGIGWSKVQWLVAAMSVGLGFGLQEVFANFVSGVILLFERPIRVGDVVSVGDTFARVSKMRIRATTLVDWDRRELVVPNKEFVTSRLTNWTLSDPITRLTFPVGIAYGSDTAKAQEKLMEVAKACPVVLDEPKPRAIFRRFGESSLDFELRVFIRNIDDIPVVMNEINTGIDNAFRKARIEIAFPQRDLHLRTAPAIIEHLGRPKREKAEPFATD